jgi:hypothetical protein
MNASRRCRTNLNGPHSLQTGTQKLPFLRNLGDLLANWIG